MFRKEAAELDRSCVVEGAGEDRKVHTTNEAVGKCQRDFFRKWFREGDGRCWFIRWGADGGGGVDPPAVCSDSRGEGDAAKTGYLCGGA